MILKTQTRKIKIDGTAYKLKFLFIKGHNQENERQSMEWKKISPNHVSHKELIFRIHIF
jgi:hypothetical protein